VPFATVIATTVISSPTSPPHHCVILVTYVIGSSPRHHCRVINNTAA
jgi:hypothetical protein